MWDDVQVPPVLGCLRKVALTSKLTSVSFPTPQPAPEVCDESVTPRAKRRLWRDWNRHILAADAEASQMKQLAVRSHVRRQVLERVQRLAKATADCGPVAEGAMGRLEADLNRMATRRAACEK